MATPSVFFGRVKAAQSGDALILANASNQERIVYFAWVAAPHLKKEGDEPFAFQSRDHLRRLTVGQQVKVSVQYTIPSSGRQYVTAELQDGTNLVEAMAQAGWLKVREEAGNREDNEEILDKIEILRNHEKQAREECKGLFTKDDDGIIEVLQELPGPSFISEWKGKTIPGRVERVLSGDRMLVRVMVSDKKHLNVMTLLAGIRCPATERVVQSTGETQPAEEFGAEARNFVEVRMLQREVNVLVVGISPQNQLIASILHPKQGDIAEFLLKDGLARCNDFHSTMMGTRMATFRSLEKDAQSKKLRLHKNHVSKTTAGGKMDMTVAKIVGADTIIVRNKAGDERRINFSSCRGPRTGEPSEAPFKDEAKEFLRKKLIGKHVNISIDGSKPAADGFEARDVATVTEKGKNIGLLLVQEGWCSVIRHRKDDTDRAPNYDELLAAQEAAKEANKGMWSGKPSKAKQYVDASESLQKAKIQLSTLSRQKKVPGIVDFCKSGSRFTVLIPREGCKLTMVLAGVRAPRAPRATGEQGEPFGQEALDLANKRCNQRDCEVDIHDIDKVGGFIGDLYINRESFAKVLVEEGLASVHAYSAEKSGNATELFAAEKKAKEGRKGMWHDWDPSQEEDATAEEETAEPAADDTAATLAKRPDDLRSIYVTNVDSSGKLKIQEIGKGTAALETIMTEFRKFHGDPKNNTPYKEAPRAGEYIAAKFSEDNCWYRARVRSNDRAAKQSEVVYIDYGNSEKLSWSNMRPLDQAKFGIQRLKAQATDAVLSLIQLPTSEMYLSDAVRFIEDITFNRKLLANFDFFDNKENTSYITIYESSGEPNPKESLNRDIVDNGHAMVPRKLKAWERSPAFAPTLKTLRTSEAHAKAERLGMWEYGDITED